MGGGKSPNYLKRLNLALFRIGLSYFYYKIIRGKNIMTSQRVFLRHVKNIDTTNGSLRIGCNQDNFINKKDWTYLNICGKMKIKGKFNIGKGCRLDIGKNAILELGDNSFINPFTNLIVMNKLYIGNNTAISWSCQFMDDDFHVIEYEGKKSEEKDEGIIIGDRVWVGCHVHIYKNVKIPNGCIIASNSVVKKTFTEENALIAGNPAKIVKHNVSWKR